MSCLPTFILIIVVEPQKERMIKLFLFFQTLVFLKMILVPYYIPPLKTMIPYVYLSNVIMEFINPRKTNSSIIFKSVPFAMFP